MQEQKNELATLITDDGQPIRAIHNYLMDTFDGIKHEELFDRTIKDRIQFIQFIQNTICPSIISSLEEWRLDHPEEYELNNQSNH